jgi:hypothetical protein
MNHIMSNKQLAYLLRNIKVNHQLMHENSPGEERTVESPGEE